MNLSYKTNCNVRLGVSTPQAETPKKKRHMIRELCIQPCKKDELRLMVFIDDINTWNDEAAQLFRATDPFHVFS